MARSASRPCAAGRLRATHDVIFAGPEEMITLSHRAENRMIFARGAVRAALWLLQQKPDRYTMPQVLGLN
jgi:4-hydroxy-tetrahydrodipicolinate reductase